VSSLRESRSAVVDAGVRERRLQPIFRDRFREGIGPFSVAAGDVASSSFLPLDDDDVEPPFAIVRPRNSRSRRPPRRRRTRRCSYHVRGRPCGKTLCSRFGCLWDDAGGKIGRRRRSDERERKRVDRRVSRSRSVLRLVMLARGLGDDCGRPNEHQDDDHVRDRLDQRVGDRVAELLEPDLDRRA